MTEARERKVNRKLKAYYFQRRVLFGCTVGLFFAFVLWIIAISTNRWYIVYGGKGELNASGAAEKKIAYDRVNIRDEINISDYELFLLCVK